MPKIFLMTKDGKLIDSIFKGETINTPSMLCVEDYIDALNWSESIGGLKFLIARADRNTAIISEWVERTPWVDFLAEDINTRSNTSVCLKIIDSEILMLSDKDRTAFAKKIADILDAEDVAYDIAGHRDAPANLRIWAGATIENDDISALMPWLDWAFVEAKASLKAIV
jgi:phosphoserine aminotransferase